MIVLPILIVIFAIIGIFQLRALVARLQLTMHKNPQVDAMLKFHLAQLALAMFVLATIYLLNPVGFSRFFHLGEVHTHIGEITWLGITGNETWLEIATSLGIFITIGTGVFMYARLRKTNTDFSALPSLFPWIILFSAMNAASEEAIFRMGIVAPLYGQLAVPVILLISGFLFGLPHFFGQPSGVIGVFMAGFLGWLLAMSLVETQGLLLAWAIHFVQDVVIIGSMFMINRKTIQV